MKTLKKRALMLLVLAVVMSINLSAQISKNIVDTTKQWNVARHQTNGIFTSSYKIGAKDTVVNEKQYYQLLQGFGYDTLSQYYNEWKFIDWIREEGGRVFILTNEFIESDYNFFSGKYPTEYLLFDFNLRLGDTIMLYREHNIAPEARIGGSAVVVSEDSVEVESVRLKKIVLRYDLSPYDEEVWVEGIGSNRGLITSGVFPYDRYFSLLCVKQNDNLVFINEIENPNKECFIHVGMDECDEEKIEIFPTIVDDFLYISSAQFPLQIQIIDYMGKVHQVKECYDQNYLNVKGLRTGIYFLKIFANNKVVVKQVIKL